MRYSICIVVGRNETFWKKFASMDRLTNQLISQGFIVSFLLSHSLKALILYGPLHLTPNRVNFLKILLTSLLCTSRILLLHNNFCFFKLS